MDVVLLPDVLLVDHVGKDPLGGVGPLEEVHEAGLEVRAEVGQELVGLVGEQEELALVRLAHRVALETILVSERKAEAHLNRDKIESNLSVPGIQGHQENALIKSFEMSSHLICL